MRFAMDDRPLGGESSGYNINWDEIDELSDPFAAKNPSQISRDPVSPKGDGPKIPDNQPEATDDSPNMNGSFPTHVEPSGSHDVEPCEPIASGRTFTLDDTCNNGEPTQSPVQAVPNGAPSAEQLTAALERVAMSNNEESDDRGYDSPHTSGEPSNTPEHDTPNVTTTENSEPQLLRIDSSTRPASPTQLLVRPNMTDISIDSLRAGVPVTEAEVLALRKERSDLVNTIDEMRRCIAEYDRSLQHLIDEKSQNQTQVNVSVADLIAERDQVIEEVATIEKAFGDLHRRFEKSKQVIESLRQNEEALKHSIQEYKTLLQTQENKYLALKKHAEEKLLKVTQETDAAIQEAETNAARLRASLRMLELQNQSLEAQLEQKQRENTELTKICEELLSKYSGSV